MSIQTLVEKIKEKGNPTVAVWTPVWSTSRSTFPAAT